MNTEPTAAPASSSDDVDISGLEQDVLRSFASLSPHVRSRLFDTYEARFGRPARLYAERAARFWLGQQVRISRELAARLFELTPAFLTPSARIALAERLWQRKRGRSEALLRVPADGVDAATVSAAARAHFADCLRPWQISAALRARFPWLDERDIDAQQQVLNMLLNAERERLLDAAHTQIDVLFGRAGQPLRQIRQEIEIAGHRLEVVSDPDCEELRVELLQSGRAARAVSVDPAALWIVACFGGGALFAVGLWWLVSRIG